MFGRGQVLVVEDDPDYARSLRQMLSEAGYTAPVVAATASDAVRLACQSEWDLVVVDIELRDNSFGGLHVLHEARVKWPGLPRLVSTQYLSRPDVLAAVVKAEPEGIVDKSSHRNEFIEACSVLIAGGSYFGIGFMHYFAGVRPLSPLAYMHDEEILALWDALAEIREGGKPSFGSISNRRWWRRARKAEMFGALGRLHALLSADGDLGVNSEVDLGLKWSDVVEWLQREEVQTVMRMMVQEARMVVGGD
jgi:CheY-like chemotaxis protein